jgi:hypothetical protein
MVRWFACRLLVALSLMGSAAAALAQASVQVIESPPGVVVAGDGGGLPTAHLTLNRAGDDDAGLSPWAYLATGDAAMAGARLGAAILMQTSGPTRAAPEQVLVQAQLFDTLTFAGAGGPAQVQFVMTLHGAFQTLDDATFMTARGRLSVAGDNAEMSLRCIDLCPLGAGIQKAPLLSDASLDVVSTARNNAIAVLTLRKTVTPGTPVSFSAGLHLFMRAGMDDDARMLFDNTASMQIHAPAGWTYTSRFGLAPVPEPGTATLWLAGLALAALARPRRRSRTPAVSWTAAPRPCPAA